MYVGLRNTGWTISRAEAAHAKIIFQMLDAQEPRGLPFDEFFEINKKFPLIFLPGFW